MGGSTMGGSAMGGPCNGSPCRRFHRLPRRCLHELQRGHPPPQARPRGPGAPQPGGSLHAPPWNLLPALTNHVLYPVMPQCCSHVSAMFWHATNTSTTPLFRHAWMPEVLYNLRGGVARLTATFLNKDSEIGYPRQQQCRNLSIAVGSSDAGSTRIRAVFVPGAESFLK